MRLRSVIVLSAVILFAMPALSAAQRREEPQAGTVAIGFEGGFLVPDEDFHTGFTPAALAEFYIGPRVSLRAMGGWSRNEFVSWNNRYLEQWRMSFNVIYNWEAEYWHPYVMAGIGGHRVRTWEDDVTQTPWQSRVGYNVGGGIEYFARPKVTFKFEAAYYYCDHPPLVHESSGLALTVGMKKYF